MKTSTTVWALALLIIVIAGGWYFYSANEAKAPTAAPVTDAGLNGSPNQGNLGATTTGAVQQPLADGAEGSVIGANLALGLDKSSTLGTHLIAYNGMTLYTFSKDASGTTTCYGACATNWPPYVVGPEDNLTHLQAGVSGKVDTIFRAGGTIQVTYNGAPLYFYAKDKNSGDTVGQGVGGVWFVAKP